jgi:Asp-tRNA(Asn)/Glu-tRNA(Gln) amidotransferase C subunit
VSVGRAQTDRIAHLARLRFEDDDLTRITEELNHILEHVESLKALEPGPGGEPPGGAGATGSAPGHLSSGGAPTVADCAPTRGAGAEEPDRLRRALSAVAPDWREGFFVVPPLPGVHDGERA